MGGVHRRDREARPTTKFDSTELAELSKKPDPETDTEIVDELDPPTVRLAAGTTPPADQRAEAVARSRTTTAHDPLTTSLLAEVTRRTQTAELSPDDLDLDKPEEKPAPTASPRLIRRK